MFLIIGIKLLFSKSWQNEGKLLEESNSGKEVIQINANNRNNDQVSDKGMATFWFFIILHTNRGAYTKSVGKIK